jgi:hypothetical protein
VNYPLTLLLNIFQDGITQMGGLRSALTQFQKLFHVDACDARGVRLPASSPITPSNVGVSVWTPTSRTSAQRRALPSVATPPAGAYLFILFLCDHLTEYFTNLMILLNDYNFAVASFENNVCCRTLLHRARRGDVHAREQQRRRRARGALSNGSDADEMGRR